MTRGRTDTDGRRRAPALILVFMLVLTPVLVGVSTTPVPVHAQAGDNTDASGAGANTGAGDTSTSADNARTSEREVISGLRDSDLALLDRRAEGGTVVLTIGSETSKTIQVADVFAGADSEDGVGFVVPEDRSLSEGRNRVEIEAASAGGYHFVGVKGDGPQANIKVEAAGSWNTPDVGGAVGAGGVILALVAISYIVTWLVRNVVRADIRRVS